MLVVVACRACYEDQRAKLTNMSMRKSDGQVQSKPRPTAIWDARARPSNGRGLHSIFESPHQKHWTRCNYYIDCLACRRPIELIVTRYVRLARRAMKRVACRPGLSWTNVILQNLCKAESSFCPVTTFDDHSSSREARIAKQSGWWPWSPYMAI